MGFVILSSERKKILNIPKEHDPYHFLAPRLPWSGHQSGRRETALRELLSRVGCLSSRPGFAVLTLCVSRPVW